MHAKFAESFLKVTVKAVASLIPGGGILSTAFEELVDPFKSSAWTWLQGKTVEERKHTFDQLASMPQAEARRIVEEELAKTELSDEVREAIARYFATIPASTRQAVTRPDDGGRPETLLSQLPRNEEELARFIPLRPPHFEPGTTLPHHDYTLQQLLGQGGFGEVWLAESAIGRFALKFCLDAELTASLQREVQLLKRLQRGAASPSIVEIHGAELSSTPPFVIFEYMDGGDLGAWLATFGGHPAPQHEVRRIAVMIARGLAYAHEHDVVHHDLKPANLLLNRQGQVKIADFGIGKLVQTAGSSGVRVVSRTATRLQGASTPMYADDSGTAKQRDIYAVGVILYQLLVGNVYEGVRPGWRSALAQHQVDEDLVELVARCLDIPEQRFTDAGALLDALERPPVMQSGTLVTPTSKRRSTLMVIGLGAVATAATLLSLRLAPAEGGNEPPPPTPGPDAPVAGPLHGPDVRDDSASPDPKDDGRGGNVEPTPPVEPEPPPNEDDGVLVNPDPIAHADQASIVGRRCEKPENAEPDRARAEALWREGRNIYQESLTNHRLGRRTLSDTQYQTAYRKYLEAASADPSFAKAYNSLGAMSFNEGALDVADCYLLHVLSLASPDDLVTRWAWVNPGWVAVKRGRCRDARTWASKARARRSNEALDILERVDELERTGGCRD